MTIDAQASRAGPRPGEAERAATLYDLGVSYSTGSAGRPLDLIEAHAWFNLAAYRGSGGAAAARAEIAGVKNRGDIFAAQRLARLRLDSFGVVPGGGR